MQNLTGDSRDNEINELLEITLYAGSISLSIILPSFLKEHFPILHFNRLYLLSHLKDKHIA